MPISKVLIEPQVVKNIITMIEKEYYPAFLTAVNEFVKAEAAKKEKERSYIRLFRPYNTNPLNIMGSFRKAIHREGTSRGKEHFTEFSRNSFGLIATEQFSDYCFLYSKHFSIFRDRDSFRRYVDTYFSHFVIDPDELAIALEYCQSRNNALHNIAIACEKSNVDIREVLQKSLYARSLITAYYVCGLTLTIETSVGSEDLSCFIQMLQNDYVLQCIYNKEKSILTIHGKPQIETFKALEESKLRIRVKEDNLILGYIGVPLKDVFNISDENSLSKYYKNNAGALYSGVIPRLCHVEYCSPTMDNSSLEGFKLHLGRTSYFTMRAMGRNAQHAYLDIFVDSRIMHLSYRNVLKAFDLYEIECQDDYYSTIDNFQNENDLGKRLELELGALNQYLSHSISQHNLNVSANLITKDDLCLYTLRGGEIEDSGDFYCSVNGGSEIYDSNVPFYHHSVEEDIPTIAYNKQNVYFGKELTREAIAELGITDDSHVWTYYGLTIMGQKMKPRDTHRMSFHFNVLGERRCTDEFEHIREQKQNAPENFESTNLYGYKLAVFQTRREKWIYICKDFFLPELLEYKDTIMWIIILLSQIILSNYSAIRDLTFILTCIFALISLCMIILNLRYIIKKNKVSSYIMLIVNQNNIMDTYALCESIRKRMKFKEQIRMDNVFRLLTIMRLQHHF